MGVYAAYGFLHLRARDIRSMTYHPCPNLPRHVINRKGTNELDVSRILHSSKLRLIALANSGLSLADVLPVITNTIKRSWASWSSIA